MQHNNPNSPLLSNQGKIVSGTDRDGDQWTITVHGPGQVIVTDTTPNDGALDDDIATIQIINSNPRTTYVTGTTVASNRVLTDGTVNFNRLIALDGVKSIDLNGFNLDGRRDAGRDPEPGRLPLRRRGDAQVPRHQCHDRHLGQTTTPYQIVIGDPSTPLKVKPSIYLDSIIQLGVRQHASTTVPTGPLTTPSVIFSVNGVVAELQRGLDHAVADPAQLPVADAARDDPELDGRAPVGPDPGAATSSSSAWWGRRAARRFRRLRSTT